MLSAPVAEKLCHSIARRVHLWRVDGISEAEMTRLSREYVADFLASSGLDAYDQESLSRAALLAFDTSIEGEG
jgi:hypothetical protein